MPCQRCPTSDGTSRTRSPGNDARGSTPAGSMPPEVETHLVNAVLTNGARYYVDHAHPELSTPGVRRCPLGGRVRPGGRADPRGLDGGGQADAARGPGDRRLQEQLRRQGQQLRLPRELPHGPARAVRSHRRPRDRRTSSRARSSPARARSAARRRRSASTRCRSSSRSGPTSSRRRSASRRRSSDRSSTPATSRTATPQVPAPSRHRRRRQPLRGLDLPEGRHHRNRAGHDRGRRPAARVRLQRAGLGDAPASPTTSASARRSSWPTAPASPRSRSSGSCSTGPASTPTRSGLACVGESVGAEILRRWEARADRARGRPDVAVRPARLGGQVPPDRRLPRAPRPGLGRRPPGRPRPPVPRPPAGQVALRPPGGGAAHHRRRGGAGHHRASPRHTGLFPGKVPPALGRRHRGGQLGLTCFRYRPRTSASRADDGTDCAEPVRTWVRCWTSAPPRPSCWTDWAPRSPGEGQMAEREQIRKPAPAKKDAEIEETPAASEKGEKIKAELDDLLDEIDERPRDQRRGVRSKSTCRRVESNARPLPFF